MALRSLLLKIMNPCVISQQNLRECNIFWRRIWGEKLSLSKKPQVGARTKKMTDPFHWQMVVVKVRKVSWELCDLGEIYYRISEVSCSWWLAPEVILIRAVILYPLVMPSEGEPMITLSFWSYKAEFIVCLGHDILLSASNIKNIFWNNK